jgi:hypothetical protein
LYGCEQTQSIVTIDNDAAENAQYEAWRCLTERENAESHRGSSDLVDQPVKRDLSDKLAD